MRSTVPVGGGRSVLTFGRIRLMSRLLVVNGALCLSTGVAWLIPALFEWSERRLLSETGITVVWLGPALIVGGAISMVCGFRHRSESRIPAPVRMAITGNVLFVSFCVLEFSDGLLRQSGRLFYWTSVLFLPALLLLYGITMARRWAWWSARGLAALFTLWFVGFAVLIPFVDLRRQGEPVPPWGRIYMIGVSLLFVSAAACAFRELGRAEAMDYFGILPRAEPGAAPNGGPTTQPGDSRVSEGPPSVS